MKQIDFTKQSAVDLRNQCIERTEVLEKVKALMLVPEIEVMTITQVAIFYEVALKTIQRTYLDNKNELENDGIINLNAKFLKGQKCPFKNLNQMNGKCEVEFNDGTKMILPNRGIKAFSKRAVLRIGMLLRDSEIAREVRTQLLNTFENASDKVKTIDINEELEIQSKIGKALLSGDIMQISEAVGEGFAYKNRHIAMLENANKDLKTVNGNLTGKVLSWSDRSCLNKAVRLLAKTTGEGFGEVWNNLYNELNYGHHINLRLRGKKPFIKHCREHEWSTVIQVFTAMCEEKGLDTAYILNRAKIADKKAVAVNG